jgi:hypothetical protein
MLQAHSFLWHYLWVAPNALALILAAAIVRRGLHKQYPFFAAYLFVAGLKELCLYGFDLSPRISGNLWWGTFWTGTIVEGLVKFFVVAELLQHLLHPWPSIARMGRNIVSGSGVFFVLVAALSAAYAAPDKSPWFIGGAHILFETLYLTLAGLIISIFLLCTFFKIPWSRRAFGIALGFGVMWCEHLGLWALVAGGVVRNRVWIDFANMATYHVAVLIWFYYLLVPEKSASNEARDKDKRPPQPPSVDPPSPLSGGSPEDHHEALEDWNRELERLIHQ